MEEDYLIYNAEELRRPGIVKEFTKKPNMAAWYN